MEPESLTILLLSDTHCAFDYLEHMARVAKKDLPDLIIISGDLATYHHEAQGTEMESEFDFDKVLRTVEKDHEVPVFYLPGNHDPPSSYEPSKKFGGRSVNFHGKEVTVAPGLSLVGFGGAVPATQNGYECWSGFPYTEQQMGDKLRYLLIWVFLLPSLIFSCERQVWEENCDGDKKENDVVLVTHCGPFDISTTISLLDVNKSAIESGSTNLRRLLNEESVQNRVVVNIHGHTHDSWGMAQVGSVTVVNPGALMMKRYARLKLQRVDGRWSISAVSFETCNK